MIIISQDKKTIINFDNVNRLEIAEFNQSQNNIIADFGDGNWESIGVFENKEFGQEVFLNLMNNYRGSSVVEVPEEKKPAGTGQ